MSGLARDAKVLRQLLSGLSGPGSHADRLERFYGPQSEQYDRFRERMLHGRGALIERLAPDAGAHVVELGAGTGRNLGFFGARLPELASLTLVDLCRPLLAVAQTRVAGHRNVHLVEADATSFRPGRLVDCVYLSYSLTMIPDWRAAIDNAVSMLKPGGKLGVVDFHVAPHHGWFSRTFWPRWFAHDGVRLSAAHLPYLRDQTRELDFETGLGSIPYLPALRVPHFLFIGCKAGQAAG